MISTRNSIRCIQVFGIKYGTHSASINEHRNVCLMSYVHVVVDHKIGWQCYKHVTYTQKIALWIPLMDDKSNWIATLSKNVKSRQQNGCRFAWAL